MTRKAAFLTDFEGDMLGHGGVLATAAFQETTSMDARTLARSAPAPGSSQMPGIFLDLGCEACVSLLRRVMESWDLTKVLWGADGDCKNLMYQVLPLRLGVQPAALVDAQLGFSKHERRLGMGRMLQAVPGHLLARLPKKDLIDFNASHSRNSRAWRAPLKRRLASYAVDDLHRIEAILRSQVPEGGDYRRARAATDAEVARARRDVIGLADLKDWEKRFSSYRGRRRTAKAVAGLRHVRSLRARGIALEDRHAKLAASVEAKATTHLELTGVEVPDDLSFAE